MAFRDRPIYGTGDTIHDLIIILDDDEAHQAVRIGESPEWRGSQALRWRALNCIAMRSE